MHKAQVSPAQFFRRVTTFLLASLLMFGGTTVLTNQAQAATEYTITFDANSSSGSTGNMAAQTAAGQANLSPNGFSRPGYSFKHWSNFANGSGTPFADEALFTFDSTKTLYAQWDPITPAVDATGPVFFLKANMSTASSTLEVKKNTDDSFLAVGINYLTPNNVGSYPVPVRQNQDVSLELTIPSGYSALLTKQVNETANPFFYAKNSSGSELGSVVLTSGVVKYIFPSSGTFLISDPSSMASSRSSGFELVADSNLNGPFASYFMFGVISAGAPPTPPSPATNFSVSNSSTNLVSLGWTASPTDSVTYTLTSSPDGPNCTVGSAGSGTTGSCTGGFTQGQEYTFSLVANKNGLSSSVLTVTVTPNPNPGPSSPTGVTAVASSTSATVSWQASTGSPSSYTVTSDPGGLTCTVSAPSTSCVVSGLTANTEYTFSVTATDGSDTSSASTPSTPVTTTTTNNNPNSSPSSSSPTPTINLSNLNGSGSNGSGGALATASAGQTFTLTGTGMNAVNQVNVGDRKAIITLKTATRLGFRLPKNLPAGTYDLSLYGSFGSMTEAKFFSVAKRKIIQTVAGFGGNSPVLNAVVNTGIKRTIARLGGGVTLVCNGSTSGARVTDAARKLARDRARAACAYAKRTNPSLTTKIRISPASSVGAQARNVKLIYRNY